jgi:hypothetical protein
VGVEQYRVRRWMEELRRDGSLVVRLPNAREAQDWRAAMRRACRAAGLRVRTGLSAGDGMAWAYHVDESACPPGIPPGCQAEFRPASKPAPASKSRPVRGHHAMDDLGNQSSDHHPAGRRTFVATAILRAGTELRS